MDNKGTRYSNEFKEQIVELHRKGIFTSSKILPHYGII